MSTLAHKQPQPSFGPLVRLNLPESVQHLMQVESEFLKMSLDEYATAILERVFENAKSTNAEREANEEF